MRHPLFGIQSLVLVFSLRLSVFSPTGPQSYNPTAVQSPRRTHLGNPVGDGTGVDSFSWAEWFGGKRMQIDSGEVVGGGLQLEGFASRRGGANEIGQFVADFGELPGFLLIYFSLLFLIIFSASVSERIAYSTFLIFVVLLLFANLVVAGDLVDGCCHNVHSDGRFAGSGPRQWRSSGVCAARREWNVEAGDVACRLRLR